MNNRLITIQYRIDYANEDMIKILEGFLQTMIEKSLQPFEVRHWQDDYYGYMEFTCREVSSA